MLGLPKNTEVSLPIYKKDLLANFDGSSKLKEAINSDIQSLRIMNELSTRSLPVEPSKAINGIFIVELIPKQQDIHQETIEAIFHLILQHIVIAIHYNDKIRLAVHHKKTFLTDWLYDSYNLNVSGLSIDEIWMHIVEAIGNFKTSDGQSLDDQIEHNTEIQAILKNIEKLEKKERNTKTPRIKYELHQKIKALTTKLEALKRY